MVIKLKKGCPIIRTRFDEEIILPFSSKLKFVENPNNNQPKTILDGSIVYFECDLKDNLLKKSIKELNIDLKNKYNKV